MAGNRTRVGVIGVGRMGERHCRIYSTLAGVEFVGLSDVSAQRGLAVANKYDVRYFPDYSDLLDQVDAVSVVTPTPYHFPVAREALGRRVHVLVEKPIADTVAEARELVRQADELGLVLQVGHIERYNPTFLELQAVLEGLQVVALNARRLSPFDTSNTDVDVVRDLMIHDIDLALTILGRGFVDIQAHGRSAQSATTDYAVATLSVAGGPVATLMASRVTEQKVRTVEITAVGAYVEADFLNKSICIHRRTLPEYVTNHHRPLRYRQESLVERIYIPTAEPLLLELEDFARCVREGDRPKVSGEDGVEALALALRIRDQLDLAAAPTQMALAS
jgi:virulence factor